MTRLAPPPAAPTPAAAPAVRRRSQAGYAVRSMRRALGEAARTGIRRLGMLAGHVGARVRPVTDVVGPVGWVTLAASVGAFGVAAVSGWSEFTYLATTLLAALLVAVVFVFGRSTYTVGVELNPHRVVAGERALGQLTVTNSGQKGLLPVRMELPVGSGMAEFVIPALAPAAGHEELFAVPTHHRAVIVAGPAVSVRGDQLGLLRRAVRWTDPVELFVHPVTTRLHSSAAGLVRDLEGEITRTITNNDISFHALRAYVPGDALRNVHWRTSARTGQLMVRQFEETRRSQLTIVHGAETTSYASDAEFELAVSVLASVALQVIRDGTRVDVVTEGVAEGLRMRTQTPLALLDDSCRIEPVAARYPTLRDFARDATRRLPAPSVAMIVAGSRLGLGNYRAVQTLFGKDAKTLAFRVELGAPSHVSTISGLTVITLGVLTDLPRLLRRVNG